MINNTLLLYLTVYRKLGSKIIDLFSLRMALKFNQIMNSFLDERMITDDKKGGTREWNLSPSSCLAEKVNWKEIVPNQYYQRYSETETTALLLQPKLHQICDLIRSSENLFLVSLTLEGRIACKARVSSQPNRTFFFSSRRMSLVDPILGQLHQFLSGKLADPSEMTIVLRDVLEENIKKDFLYKSNWSSIEVVSAKIHFKNEESDEE